MTSRLLPPVDPPEHAPRAWAGIAPLVLLAVTASASGQIPLYTISGAQPGDAHAFGSGVGDFDGDGVPDFAVAAPLAGSGTLTLYSGADFEILGLITGQGFGDGFGFAVASAPDVFGTGRPSLLVGAPWYDGPNGADAGRAYVYEYQAPFWILLQVVDGEGGGDELGYAVAAAGHVDGDARDDVIIGAPRHDGPAGSDAGRAYVMGDSGGGFVSIGNPLDGPQADGAYGTSVCGAGDVDGDLRDDVIVGAPEAERAFVHAHALGTWSLVWALQDDSSSLFGTSVAAANLTVDAVPDLIVGAPEDDDAGPDAGSVIVFDGATGGVVYEASGSVPLGSYFGYSVAACEDLDGDGVQELLVGVPEANPSNTGAVRLLSGATGATLYTLFGDAPEDGLGECVAAIGDVTGNGRPEILAGAPQVPDMGQAGPGYVRVYTGWGAIGSNYCGPAVVNSSGDSGVIHALGSHVAADSDVSLVAVQLPTNKFGYFLNSMSAGSIDNPGGSQGKLCLSGAIGRYQQLVQNTGDAGSATLVLDLSQTPTPSGLVAVQAGETWRFQLWFRDNNPGPTSNFTDAVAITFQ